MATQAIENAPAADGAEASPAKGKRTVLILAVAGIAAGTAAGLFGVGPVLAKRRANAPAAAPKTELAAASVNHEVANLVLNPAGSGGTRFLMVTATFQLKDAGTDQLMKDHEAEVRDRILALLGKKTVDDLTDISKRDSMKAEVLGVIVPLFPKGTVLNVFFPQFVIQ
jgi:flagellar protein FliL